MSYEKLNKPYDNKSIHYNFYKINSKSYIIYGTVYIT